MQLKQTTYILDIGGEVSFLKQVPHSPLVIYQDQSKKASLPHRHSQSGPLENAGLLWGFIALVLCTDLQPSVERGQVQGRLLPAVSHGGVGQLVEQHRNHIRVAILGCTVKRRLLLMVL